LKNPRKTAFRFGLMEGFSSSYHFVSGDSTAYTKAPRNRVGMSWKNVGSAIKSAIEQERQNIGETSNSGPKRG
jgi:hypothetical protein